MSQDIFIKIAGIEGEALDAAHKNEIEVLNWTWNVQQPSGSHVGSGQGSGKATIGNLEFVHFIDRASPNLMKYCFSGKPITEVVLTMRKAGGAPLEYLKITLKDVIVSLVQPVASVTDEGRGREKVYLSFDHIKQEYVVQNAQGGSGGAVTAGWDIKANKEA